MILSTSCPVAYFDKCSEVVMTAWCLATTARYLWDFNSDGDIRVRTEFLAMRASFFAYGNNARFAVTFTVFAYCNNARFAVTFTVFAYSNRVRFAVTFTVFAYVNNVRLAMTFTVFVYSKKARFAVTSQC